MPAAAGHEAEATRLRGYGPGGYGATGVTWMRARKAATTGGCQRFARALRRADLDLATRFTGARRAAVLEPVALRFASRLAAADFPFAAARAFALAPDFRATDVVFARLRDAARLSRAARGAGFPAATPVLLLVLAAEGVWAAAASTPRS